MYYMAHKLVVQQQQQGEIIWHFFQSQRVVTQHKKNEKTILPNNTPIWRLGPIGVGNRMYFLWFSVSNRTCFSLYMCVWQAGLLYSRFSSIRKHCTAPNVRCSPNPFIHLPLEAKIFYVHRRNP